MGAGKEGILGFGVCLWAHLCLVSCGIQISVSSLHDDLVHEFSKTGALVPMCIGVSQFHPESRGRGDHGPEESLDSSPDTPSSYMTSRSSPARKSEDGSGLGHM